MDSYKSSLILIENQSAILPYIRQHSDKEKSLLGPLTKRIL